MIRKQIRSAGTLWLMFVSAFGVVVAQEAEPGAAKPKTALELMELSDNYLESFARGNVIQMFSEKSEGGLVPEVWSIDFYDLNASSRPVRLKFIKGVAEEQSRPLRIGSRLAGQTRPLPKQKLVVDSDKALEIAKAQPDLKGVELTASKMELIWDDNSQRPAWRVRFYARKKSDSSQVVDIEFVVIAAETGEVLRNSFILEKVR